jgi:hypothetical protein
MTDIPSKGDDKLLNYGFASGAKPSHGLEVAEKTRLTPEGWVPDWRWAPDYISTMTEWIRKQTQRAALGKQ